MARRVPAQNETRPSASMRCTRHGTRGTGLSTARMGVFSGAQAWRRCRLRGRCAYACNRRQRPGVCWVIRSQRHRRSDEAAGRAVSVIKGVRASIGVLSRRESTTLHGTVSHTLPPGSRASAQEPYAVPLQLVHHPPNERPAHVGARVFQVGYRERRGQFLDGLPHRV